MAAQLSPPANPASEPHLPESLLAPWIGVAAAPEIIREDYFGNARLRGRVVLVAGARGDVAGAIVAHVAREGAKVVLVHADDGVHARRCEQLVRAEGSDCLLIDDDLRDMAAREHVISRVIAHFGHFDILVNGIEPPAVDLVPGQPSWRPTGAGHSLSLAAMPRLATHGSIIHTVGMTPAREPDPVSHARVDAAVAAMTRSFAAQAAAHGVRLNAIVLGAVAGIPVVPPATALVKRAGQPADIGPAHVFLASEDASFITAQVLHVDGGRWAREAGRSGTARTDEIPAALAGH